MAVTKTLPTTEAEAKAKIETYDWSDPGRHGISNQAPDRNLVRAFSKLNFAVSVIMKNAVALMREEKATEEEP